MRKLAVVASAVIALSALAPNASEAAVTLSGCSTDCAGYFSGNVFSNSDANVTIQKNALASLGFTWDGVTSTTLGGNSDNNFIPGGAQFIGTTYVGVHYTAGGNQSAFYKFDAGSGLDFFSVVGKTGNAVLYSTGIAAVPEPATWAMMVLGFAGMGVTLRARRRKQADPALTFAAA